MSRPIWSPTTGGNARARPAAEAWADREREVELRWHDWWRTPRVRGKVDEIDPDASHASWMETFPWTRVEGVALPAGHKSPVDLSNRDEMSPTAFREVIGDGSFGGDYQRSDEEIAAVWEVAVREVRERLSEGWCA